MKYNYFVFFFFVAIYSLGFAQTTILCEGFSTYIKFENEAYVPTVTENNDNTTIIPQEIISTLDGNSFYVSKYNSLGEGNPGAPMKDVPEDFKLKITFNYDTDKAILYANSVGVSPCGNEFSIGLYGVEHHHTENVFGGLNLWETISIKTNPSEFSQPCHNIESILYYTLGLCLGVDSNFFLTTIEIDNSASTKRITLTRDTATFGQEVIELSQTLLSVEKNNFEQIELITSKNNASLNFTNLKNSRYHLEVFSILGEKIIKRIPFEKNSISLNTLPNGLYILKLSNSKNEYKTFKYLN